MYQTSDKLEFAILKLAPPFTDKGTICQNWQQLQAWHASTGYQYKFLAAGWPTTALRPIVVHTLGTGPEHNIFSTRRVHYAFRAWHDYLHLQLDADFSNAGEYRVCCAHIKQLRQAGISAIDRRAIWAFVAGEVAHYWRHKQFIDYKREFVSYALVHGVPDAIKQNWNYAPNQIDHGSTF